jgi:PAS domain S-box-containing protein
LQPDWLKATGDMADRIRAFDWGATPLGPMRDWPTSLTTALNLVLESPVPMVLIWGRKLVMLQNDAYQAMMAPPPEALGGSYLAAWGAITDIVTPQINEAFSGRSVHVETQGFDVYDDQGGFARKFFDYSFSPVRDERGEVAGLLHAGFEITARERAYKALRESEFRLQTLVDGIPQLVWRAKAGGLWIWASSQWQEQTGQRIEESLGLGWLEAIYPGDRDNVTRCWQDASRTGRLDVEARICTTPTDDCRWFQIRATPVRDEAGKIVEWLGTATDIHCLRELQERQSVLVAELQHRTRNLINVVKAISRRTLQKSGSLDDFEHRFGERLAALSRVQGLLSNLSAGQRVTFDTLLKSELSAMGAPEDRVLLNGPDGVELRSAMVQTMALALHELATNATKHGAFGADCGRLTVRWRVVPEGDEQRLLVDWQETGVFMDEHTARAESSGYGRELIEQALPYQLGAKTTFRFGKEGVHCMINVPVALTKG